ncbi:TetR/AcrR family transcriptional regulator [Nocardiopsis sp. EMB25]|uniref:TetR/AcrR family transcriptional regulator n=1 Tax=Nocardiopsis sp. EMB25 TaxID=2835867 RepID=UPI0022846126|nr:TetR/AcrR family transcriptional regulator [Nocardiopsis sp. EMB25]MCY9786719.1 TetR/AcrR family transcriptional regulator [Nocardiopsis sp. EMB25]
MPNPTERVELIAATALELIADRGLRGLTHRAVDEAAGLPPGSTSYHARTRQRLIETALTWLVEQEEKDTVPLLRLADVSREETARLAALFVRTSVTRDRKRSLARYELALEAARNPELREVYDRLGERFRDTLDGLMAALGSPTPRRHTRAFLGWTEGTLFDSLVGVGAASPLSEEELRTTALAVLDGLLDADPADAG